MKGEMTTEEHKERHFKLHRALDELVADMINHTGRLPSSLTVVELMEWSHKQTKNPTPDPTIVEPEEGQTQLV